LFQICFTVLPILFREFLVVLLIIVFQAILASLQAILALFTVIFLDKPSQNLTIQAHQAISHAIVTKSIAISHFFQLVNNSHNFFIISGHFSHNNSHIAKLGFSCNNFSIFISAFAFTTSLFEFLSNLSFV
jgi:hypothetical protein